jgi:heme/copper-type cytochrome/quinol oxidase subunit 2
MNIFGLFLSGLRRVDDEGKAPSGKAEGTGGESAAANPKDTIELIAQYVNYFCVFILVACGILATFFAVYVGFKLASAEEEGKRKEAKNQLIYSIIGVIGIIIVAVLIQDIVKELKINGLWVSELGSDKGVDAGLALAVNKIMVQIEYVVKGVLSLLATAGVVFAVYVGWNLMKAEEEGKRKQAKMQLVYTVVGVVAIVLLNVLSAEIILALVQLANKK